MGFVVIVKGPEGNDREFRLVEGETPIGREPSNALHLEGRGVSRRHAKFVLSGERLVVADLGSTYGTRVNDVTTLRRELLDGDEVTVGMYQLKVKVIPDENPSAPTTDPGLNPWEEMVYSADEVTQSPDELCQLRTQKMSRNPIEFVVDGEGAAPPTVQIVPRQDSDLIAAVQRMGNTPAASLPPASATIAPKSSDYKALLLMYKVSELLVGAEHLKDFVQPVADIVLEEVKADTVVVLLLEETGELTPEVIRHRGKLQPGELPVSRGIVDRVLKEKAAIMSNDVGQDSRIPSGHSIMLYKVRAVLAFPLFVQGELRGVLYIGRSWGQGFSSEERELVGALASLISSGIERAELQERVLREKRRRSALERFHPPEVVDRLFHSKAGEVSLEEHKASVLVCDLQGFPNLVHKVPPRQLATVLHEYYEMLYEKIFANGGSLVKLHDGWALALFGTPHSHDRDAVWAIESAMNLCDEFTSVSVLWPESQTLAFRCALDTGTVVAGLVGSTERLEYTAIGLPISTASKMALQAHGTSIWITERTWTDLPKARYKVQDLPPLSDLKLYRIQR